jgi:hypothetical protein
VNPDYQALAAWLLAILGVPEDVMDLLKAVIDGSAASARRALLQPSAEPFHGRFSVSSKALLARCAFGLSLARLLLSIAHSFLLVSRSLTPRPLHVHEVDSPAGNGQEPIDELGALVRRNFDLQRLVRSQLANEVAHVFQRDRGNHEDETTLLVIAFSEVPRFLRVERPRQPEEEPIVVEEEVDDADILLHQLSVPQRCIT